MAEYQASWPDGSIHWIAASGKAHYDDAGQAFLMVGVTQDITEQKLFGGRAPNAAERYREGNDKLVC